MRRVVPLAVAAAALAALAGCSEEGLTGVEGEEPPGQAADAVSVTLTADELPLWRDTSFVGFATDRDVPFVVAADQPPLESRALFTVADVPDSVAGQAVDSTGDMFLRVVADTVRSTFSGDSATLELFSLGRDFVEDEVTWERASEGTPWDSAGGDLESRMGDHGFRFDADADSLSSDTIRMPFSGDPDSLVAAWQEEGGVPPMALLVRGEGNRMVIRDLTLELQGRSADMDSLQRIEAVASASAFIHDPDLPDVGRHLRAGGLPSSRFYFAFRPPDSVEGVPIRGAQVNRAELVFHPVSDPGGAFRPPVVLSSLATDLLADPFRFGARTPIGDAVGGGQVTALDPDSLSAGRPLRVRVTDLLQTWANAPADSIDEFRLGVRPVPDGQDLGFWDFGSVEAEAGARPELRILITPPTDFTLP